MASKDDKTTDMSADERGSLITQTATSSIFPKLPFNSEDRLGWYRKNGDGGRNPNVLLYQYGLDLNAVELGELRKLIDDIATEEGLTAETSLKGRAGKELVTNVAAAVHKAWSENNDHREFPVEAPPGWHNEAIRKLVMYHIKRPKRAKQQYSWRSLNTGNTVSRRPSEASIQQQQAVTDVHLSAVKTPLSTANAITGTSSLKILPKFSACTIVIRRNPLVEGLAQVTKIPTSLLVLDESLAKVGNEFLAQHLNFEEFMTILSEELNFDRASGDTLVWMEDPLGQTKCVASKRGFFTACSILYNSLQHGTSGISFVVTRFTSKQSESVSKKSLPPTASLTTAALFEKYHDDEEDYYNSSLSPREDFLALPLVPQNDAILEPAQQPSPTTAIERHADHDLTTTTKAGSIQQHAQIDTETSPASISQRPRKPTRSITDTTSLLPPAQTLNTNVYAAAHTSPSVEDSTRKTSV
jgi:hypothetical protein